MNEGPWLECAINTPSWVLSTCSNFARVGYRRQSFTKSCGCARLTACSWDMRTCLPSALVILSSTLRARSAGWRRDMIPSYSQVSWVMPYPLEASSSTEVCVLCIELCGGLSSCPAFRSSASIICSETVPFATAASYSSSFAIFLGLRLLVRAAPISMSDM
jgi:hypothetical protein